MNTCRRFLIACLVMATVNSQAQSPGGVGTGLKLWLKANTGVTVSTSNTATQWNDVSGAGITGNFSTANNQLSTPVQPPGYQSAGINFNPHIAFDKTIPNSLVSINAFPGASLLDPTNNTVLQVIKLHTTTGTGVWLKWQFSNTSSYRLGNEVNPSSNGGRLRFDFPSGSLYSTTPIFDKYTLVNLGTTTQKTIRFNGAQDAAGTTTTNFAPGTTPGRFSLGNEYTGDAYPTTVDIAEVIIFSRALTAAERNKVESYLAIKYGFTLIQTGTYANDYTSSAGTVLWGAVADTGYGNNIIGIGRDDASGLSQLQSRSINTAGIVTMYHGAYTGATAPTININNTNPFTADNTFELIGDNAKSTTLTQCFAGPPAGFKRMLRLWKARETGGATGTITLAVNATDVPAGTAHLLVSTDTAFTPANTTVYKLTTASGVLSASLTLPNGSYFTFASDSLIAHVSSNSPVCEGTSIALSGSSSTGTYAWTGPDGFTSTDQNPVITNATATNGGTYTLGGTAGGCPVYPASVNVTVYPNPSVEFFVTENACLNEPVDVHLTTPSAAITSFAWDFDNGVITNGGSNEGPYQLTYNTIGVKHIKLVTVATGCPPRTLLDSVTIRPLPEPHIIVYPSPDVCPGDSVFVSTQFQGIQNYYYWSPEPYFAHTSNQDPLKTVYPDSSGFIKVQVVTPYGCKGQDSTMLNIIKCCTMAMPNVFTPNGDGLNDRFRPISNSHYRITEFRIFNRWGQQIYEGQNAGYTGWDGTWQGEPQPIGTYYYILSFQCKGEKPTIQKGDFMLAK